MNDDVMVIVTDFINGYGVMQIAEKHDILMRDVEDALRIYMRGVD